MKTKQLLLIFTRNPELGKCKTRLAATIGDQAALDVYTFLLEHTVKITTSLAVTKEVFYSENSIENDLWDANTYTKKVQEGNDLGKKMENAFAQGFQNGYDQIIIIGSDMYDLNQSDLEHAFEALHTHDYVIGPAEDGGYYLFGMKSLNSQVFKNKEWGTPSVYKDTIKNIKNSKIKILEERNDVDYYEDIKDIPAFQQFLN